VLTAYFDESGSKSTSLVTIAGYIADERRWKRFEREWASTLKEYDVQYLHMKEYAHRRGEFKGWPERKRRALMSKLVWIIKSNVKFRVGVVVPCEAYKLIVGLLDPNDTRLSPFWHCFQYCLRGVVEYCQKHKITDDIALVFDENNESSKHATGFYTAFKQSPNVPNRNQLVSLSFADDKKLTPLQAADLLAYEFNKYHQGYVRKPLDMLDGTDGAFGMWTAEMLKQYASALSAAATKRGGK
jgi:hypothetical protein